MFNEVFLWDYNKRLIFHLQAIFETDKTALCCFLDTEYRYGSRHWQIGETWNVPLSEQIEFEEKIWLGNEKKTTAGTIPTRKIKKSNVFNIFVIIV